MKKFVALLFCFILIFSLISCNTNEQDFLNNQKESESEDKTVSTILNENELALQMYEAAINGEICVVDGRLGEIKLKDCRFPSDNLRLNECDILNKAILDMDGDGINEYVIQSETKEHIVLHY